jgi:hypothetical protein
MKSHRIPSLPQLSQRTKCSGMPILLATFAVAALFVAGQAAAQTATASTAQPAAAQPAAAAPAPAAPEISAPVPMNEQASLANGSSSPFSESNSAFGADQTSAPAQNLTAPAHTQGPHHTLGKTMAILGMVALGAGAASYALAAEHCKKDTGQICGGLHNGGIGLMAGGGALASVGFYWEFQKPKQ